MKRLRTISVMVSAIVCGLLVVIFPVSYHLDPGKHGVAVTSSFHVCFFDGGVWFYSHDKQPYMGSITSIGLPDAHEIYRGWHTADGAYDVGQITFIGKFGEFVDKKNFCTLPGVYFRYFQVHGQIRSLWTLMLSLWYPILLLAVLPALWIFRRRHLWFK